MDAFRNDNAELAQMCPDRVGKLCQLTDQKITCPVLHQHGRVANVVEIAEQRAPGM